MKTHLLKIKYSAKTNFREIKGILMSLLPLVPDAINNLYLIN